MSDFETLYKLKENGSIYLWKIEYINPDSNTHMMRVTHGQKGGKMITHEKDIVPKAKRNHEEQFDLIASRKWNDKIDKEGYSKESDYSKSSPTSKNEKKILVRPMLAQTFDKSKYIGNKRCKKINFPCFGQPKFDGIRCLMYLKDGNVIMESRKGTEIFNFTKLREEFMKTLGIEENLIFDGELYVDSLPFEKINGLVRLKKINEKQEEEINKIEYYIYDIIDMKNKENTFKERNKLMKDINNKYKSLKLIKFSECMIINSLSDVESAHTNYVENGYEGLILRNTEGKYEINKRSYDLQKYKHFMDEEFEIIDYCQGTGNEKGLIIFKCKTKENKEFSVRPRGTREKRRKMFMDGDSYIGKQLTVIFQEYSNDGIPRFPVGKSIRYAY